MTPSPFDMLYGLEALEHGEDGVQARVCVSPRITQPGGVVHGGVYAAIAQALAEEGTRVALASERGDKTTVLTNHTTLLRPIGSGEVHAHARPVHRGRSTWVWRSGCEDDQGRLCATSIVTVSIARSPAPAVAEQDSFS